MMNLDPRLHAYRDDLADARLKGKVSAAMFREGNPAVSTAPIASLHRAPRSDAMQLTEVLLGERLRVFDMNEGWTWVQLEEDGYVGYLASDAISESAVPPTHIIDVPSTFLYPVPNIKSQPVVALPLNGAVSVVEEDERFARLAGGSFVFRKHLRKAGTFSKGFVSIAEQFLHVPYLWGGKSAAGLDCSGLVQLSLQAAGIPSPRDSDMQEEALGAPLSKDDLSNLRRGDLVFWDGHVGIMTDPAHLLHANGFHMQVIREPLHEAVDRITAMYGHITSIKRL